MTFDIAMNRHHKINLLLAVTAVIACYAWGYYSGIKSTENLLADGSIQIADPEQFRQKHIARWSRGGLLIGLGVVVWMTISMTIIRAISDLINVLVALVDSFIKKIRGTK
jgi:hypothetical protein